MSLEMKEQRIRGVFSSQEVRTIGTGTTQRKTIQKVFWFVEQDEQDGMISIQSINLNYVPTGSKKIITLEELLEKYSPEPEFYVQSVFPKMQEMNDSVNKGDTSREKGENYTAEFAYGSALALDEENVRANFGIGLTYLARGEADKADNIFERLVNLEAAFEEEHKHLFNDFGISLRKNKMYRQAQEYYERGLLLCTADENLHINMARTLFEQSEYMGCVKHLLSALLLVPQSDVALKFLSWIDKKHLIPGELQAQVDSLLREAEANTLAAGEMGLDEVSLDFSGAAQGLGAEDSSATPATPLNIGSK